MPQYLLKMLAIILHAQALVVMVLLSICFNTVSQSLLNSCERFVIVLYVIRSLQIDETDILDIDRERQAHIKIIECTLI